ncbi:MAG: secretin N-terminal domain-containing protein [Planctomycetota bacterium]
MIVLACAAGLGWSQESDSRLAGRISLARLVDVAADRVGIDIQYDESQLQQSVTLRIGTPLADAELWALVHGLLGSYGWTTVGISDTNMLRVVRVAEASDLSYVRTQRGDDQEGAGVQPGFEAVVLHPEHLTTEQSLALVRPLLSKAGQITELGSTGAVFIRDHRDRLRQSVAIWSQFDLPSTAPIVRRIRPRHVSASRLLAGATQAVTARDVLTDRPLVGRLVPLDGTQMLLLVAPETEFPAWEYLLAQIDIEEDRERREYRPRHFGLDEVESLVSQLFDSEDVAISVVKDTLTGTLLITATPSQHDDIRDLIDRLDAVDVASRRSMRTFAVRNRPVDEVVGLLGELIEAGVTQALAPPAAESSASQAPATTPSGLAVDGLALTADAGTSSIIAIGEPRLLDELERLLGTIDKRQPQVMLEVSIVALNEGQTFDLGVELESIEMSGDTLFRVASLFGLSTSGDDGRVVGDALGFTGVVLNPGDFSVVVRALETVTDGRSFSSPRLLVNNNEQATLDSITEEPFLSVNASDTVATTSFGGSSQAGTQVTLRPQIAEGDHLLLEYDISLSAFVGDSSDPSLPPPRQDSSLSSVATIPDGYAVVLGGLETTQEGDSETRLPLLGRIPLVGALFKNQSSSGSRTRFYVLVRASVVRGDRFEALKHLGRRTSVELGIDDGWPEVEPRLIFGSQSLEARDGS